MRRSDRGGQHGARSVAYLRQHGLPDKEKKPARGRKTTTKASTAKKTTAKKATAAKKTTAKKSTAKKAAADK